MDLLTQEVPRLNFKPQLIRIPGPHLTGAERGRPPLSRESIPTQPFCATLDLSFSFSHTEARKEFQNGNCFLAAAAAAAANQTKIANTPGLSFTTERLK